MSGLRRWRQKRWESPEYLPVIFEPPHDADPFDRRTWVTGGSGFGKRVFGLVGL